MAVAYLTLIHKQHLNIFTFESLYVHVSLYMYTILMQKIFTSPYLCVKKHLIIIPPLPKTYPRDKLKLYLKTKQ
jgi:hypothetical protein